MPVTVSTIRTARPELLGRLEEHQLVLINSLIEAEILQNATIKRALQTKVNETLKSFGVQDVGGKAAK